MAKIYCPECGKPNEHGGMKPKFCGFCQSPLDEVSAGNASTFPVRKTAIARKPRRIVEEEDEYEFAGELPDIDKLDIEIVLPSIERQTVGQVIGSDATPDPSPSPRKKRSNKFAVTLEKKKPQKINSQQILNDFQHRIFDTKRIDLNPND